MPGEPEEDGPVVIRISSVEGNGQRLDGGALFGNAPRAMWEKWMPPDAGNRVALSTRGLLADGLDGRRVLFDAGIGAFFAPEMKERYGVRPDGHLLLDSLKGRGIPHEDIDAVVLSHLHFDHAGGLLAAWEKGKPPRLLFPKAKFLVSGPAWERARNPHSRDRASFIRELPGLLEESGRLEVVEEGKRSSLGSSVRFRFSHGHTPGMMLSEIGGDGGVVFCADLVVGRAWVNPSISMGYDRSAEQASDEKRAFLEDAAARELRLFFTHDPGCALARLGRDEKGGFATTGEAAAVEGLEL